VNTESVLIVVIFYVVSGHGIGHGIDFPRVFYQATDACGPVFRT